MKEKQKSFVSAIVYLHQNESEIIPFLHVVHSVLSENFEQFELVFVNDASADRSRDTLKQAASRFSGCMVSILNMSYYQGLEASMCAGVDLAIGDFIFEFDTAVIDYDPELILQVFHRCQSGFDIVACGKETERPASMLFYYVYNRSSGAQYRLKSETFRLISRRGINRVNAMNVSLPYRKAVYANCGLKMDFIAYTPTVLDSGGRRKTALKNPQDTALTSLILFTNFAYRATLAFTFLMMLATVGSIAYVVAVYVMGNPVEGYTTIMMLSSGAFFALFAIQAVVIKYLSVILGLVFQKQRYVVESIEKITE